MCDMQQKVKGWEKKCITIKPGYLAFEDETVTTHVQGATKVMSTVHDLSELCKFKWRQFIYIEVTFTCC
jgi:hypothetical protein